MSFHMDNKWTRYLQKCTTEYNSAVHHTIQMKPKDVTKSKEKFLLRTVYNYNKELGLPKFRLNDFVRVSRSPKLFQKGYKFLWSAEVFQIYRINRTIPVTYLLKDEDGEKITGRFYEEVQTGV